MKHFTLFFVLFSLFSCNRGNVGKQLENFVGMEVVLPKGMQGNLQGRDTLLSVPDAPMRLVVWFDSLGCSSCRINRMHEWNDVVQFAEGMGDRFDPVFIFSPKAADRHSVRIALRTAFFEYPVYIDEDGMFPKNNPQLPTDERMHTFLLNADNKVVLVGSPVGNEALWELYKEQIRGFKN